MLVHLRRRDQSIMVGDDLCVTVQLIRGKPRADRRKFDDRSEIPQASPRPPQ